MIKIGSLNISSFKLGGADCSIYLGSVKLYPSEEPTPIGIITYEASEKLAETTSSSSSGLHVNAFNDTNGQQLTMTSHTFENGVGTIRFNGDIARIGEFAFYGCSNLTSVDIPNSATSIGGNAFYNCYSLTSITIPNSVTSIANDVFHNCTGLTSVTIGDSVTSISNGAFQNCSGLTSVNIPNSVTSIGISVFEGCSSLTSVNIPNSVTSISNRAFARCSSLTSVTMPNSATSIGAYAFLSCSSLTSVNIPNSVTSIGGYAFLSCSSLTSITVNATTPPTLGSSAFDITNNCLIYVPSASVDAYKAASGWSTYASRIQAIQ